MQADLILKDIDYLLLDPYQEPRRNISVAVKDGIVVQIGDYAELGADSSDCRVIDCADRLAHPGLINLHCHANQHLARGLTDNLDIQGWINSCIYPYENEQTHDDVHIAALSCFMELVRSGTTCFVDPGAFHMDAVCDAADEIGIRGVVGYSVMDVFSGDRPVDPERRASAGDIIDDAKEFIAMVREKHSDRVRPSIALRSESMVSDELARMSATTAESEDVLVQCHVAGQRFPVEEHRRLFGNDPVERLNAAGLFNKRFLAAHCVHIRPEDVSVFAETDTAVTYCPTSSNIIAAAHTQCGQHRALVDAGVRVGLGADSAPASNSQDLFRVMSTVTVQRDIHEDATLFPARHILDMATRIGASAAGWPELGVIAVGGPADIVLHDIRRPEWVPIHDPVSNLVHSASGASVRTVVIDGKVILDDGEFPGLDEKEILRKAQVAAEDLAKRASLKPTASR